MHKSMRKPESPPPDNGDNDRKEREGRDVPATPAAQGKGVFCCPACGAYAYRHDRYCACCGTSLHLREPRARHPVAFFCTQCGGGLDRERE